MRRLRVFFKKRARPQFGEPANACAFEQRGSLKAARTQGHASGDLAIFDQRVAGCSDAHSAPNPQTAAGKRRVADFGAGLDPIEIHVIGNIDPFRSPDINAFLTQCSDTIAVACLVVGHRVIVSHPTAGFYLPRVGEPRSP